MFYTCSREALHLDGEHPMFEESEGNRWGAGLHTGHTWCLWYLIWYRYCSTWLFAPVAHPQTQSDWGQVI